MAKDFRPFYVLNGGGTGSLDSLPVATFEDVDASFGQTDGIFYSYSFDASATNAESSPMYIRPDDNAFPAAGVHVLQSIGCNNLTLEGGSVQLKEQSSAQSSTAGYGQLWIKDDAPNVLKFTDDTGTDFDMSLSGHTHTESDVTDLQSYLLNLSGSPLSELSDVTITSIAAGEVLKWTGAAWINNTLAEAGVSATGHSHTESDISNLQSYYVPGGTDVAIVDGGTGQSTAQLAINALSAVAGATNEYVLTKDTGTGNALWKVATGGSGLGTNLSSTTNDILSDTGILLLGGTGNTNNENLLLDFETTANEVGISSGTGVTNFNFTGTLELEPTTSSTTGVIYKGADRFIHNFQHPTGDTTVPTGLNTCIGVSVGNFTMGSTATSSKHGSYNNFMGANSGYSNTTGDRNNFMGYRSGYSNTTGNRNNFMGYHSGRYYNGTTGANTTSAYCTLIGNSTSVSADGVQREIAIGYNAIGKGTDTAIIGAEGANERVYLTGGATINDEELDYDTNIAALGITNALFVQGSDGFVGINTGTPICDLDVDGGLALATTAKTAAYTATVNDHLITAKNTSGSSYDISLPAAATATGLILIIKSENDSVDNIGVNPDGSELIENSSTSLVLTPGDAVMIMCDGTEWWVI